MSRGNQIIVNANPKGRFDEGIIIGTPKPGTLMEETTAPLVSGRRSYQAITRATGTKGPNIVLLGDVLQGKLETGAAASFGPALPGDAYVTGTRGFLYWPQAGDELNMIVADVAGTADDVAVGALFVAQQTTGKLVANSSNASTPWEAQEAVTDPTADYLLWVRYNGDQS